MIYSPTIDWKHLYIVYCEKCCFSGAGVPNFTPQYLSNHKINVNEILGVYYKYISTGLVKKLSV